MYYRFFSTMNVPACFRKKRKTVQAMIVQALVGAGANLAMAGSAFSQEQAVEEIIVEGSGQSIYRIEKSSLGKFTEALIDTPQSVTTISSQLMEDRNVMNLDDALRNVPGITLGAGEFSWQGNNPSIRGFSSRNDMFLDGMRDLGSYARDPFNLDAVEVLMGPSSMVFGRGSTGGVINQSTKKPVADRAMRKLHINMGNASTMRATADINQPLSVGENSAFRLNLLGHKSEVPGRDVVETERYGVAPSLSMSLGSATQLTLSYMRLESDSIPDYGFPWIEGQPAEVDRENFYGFKNDYLETEADVSSVIMEHQINANLMLNAQVRYADYSRRSQITEPQVELSVQRTDAPENVTVHRMIFSGESDERMLQSQINLRADFTSGAVMHTLVTGLETATETSNPSYGFASQTPFFDYGILVPTTNLANPDGVYTGITARRLKSDANSDTLAAYLLDTIKFNDQWHISLGVRWDRFDTNYIESRFDVDENQTSSAQVLTKDIETSYRTALVYKPADNGTVYLGWGTSFNPSGESISFISSGRGLNTSNVSLEPEENESLELGTKWSLMDDRLQLDAAVFRITKTNARVSDPLNPGFNTLAGEQEIKGYSVNLSGGVGDILHFTTGLTHLDDAQKNTLTGSTGKINNVAENTFNFWVNWARGNSLDFGIGTRYMDERVVNNSKTAPDYWALDAMAKYQYSDNLVYKVNLTNLTDELYFDQLHPWHVIPGPGFTAVFAVNLDY